MKYLLFLWGGLVVCSSCNSKKGEIIGLESRNWKYKDAGSGMTVIPGGSFQIGQSEDSAFFSFDNKPKIISISSFYMDETEVTNHQYREFVNYTRDSISYITLGNQYVNQQTGSVDWRKKINYKDDVVKEDLEMLYINDWADRSHPRKFDNRQLIYEYYEIDYQLASANSRKIKYDKGVESWTYDENNPSREDFVIKNRIPIYPDTLCWVHDYTYAFNDPMTKFYFWHPAYDLYPLVGVSWDQAKAFCNYRTMKMNKELSRKGTYSTADYRLPTEAEWEFASRAGVEDSRFNWEDPYVRSQTGGLLANFKSSRGNYMENTSKINTSTMKVGAFGANPYGLYDMAGNVSEWTSTNYFVSGYEAMHDMNSEISFRKGEIDSLNNTKRVVRGGSWKDVSLFLENATRIYEYQDTAKCYIGFRCVQSRMQ